MCLLINIIVVAAKRHKNHKVLQMNNMLIISLIIYLKDLESELNTYKHCCINLFPNKLSAQYIYVAKENQSISNKF